MDEISSFDHLAFDNHRGRLPRALSQTDPYLRGVVLTALMRHFSESVARKIGEPLDEAIWYYVTSFGRDQVLELEEQYFAGPAPSPEDAVKIAGAYSPYARWPRPQYEVGVNEEIRENRKHSKIVRGILEECSQGERRHKHTADPYYIFGCPELSQKTPRFVVKMRGDKTARRFLVRLRADSDES